MKYKIMDYDPYLKKYESDLDLRADNYNKKYQELTAKDGTLGEFANGDEYYGIHRTADGWVYREWAPAADEMYFTGEFNNWNPVSHPMKKLDNGDFEIVLKGKDALKEESRVLAIVRHAGQTEGKVNRRIREDFLVPDLDGSDLNDDRQGIHHKDAADQNQRDLSFGYHGHGGQNAA